MELYLKFTYATRESYSLNNICQIEIGKGKLNYDEYGSLKRLYKDNFPKFVDYNIRDVTLLEELDSKLNLITLANHIAYKCHCGIEDIMSPIKSWDSFIYSEFVKKGYVLRPRQNIEVAEPLMGGYVKLPTTGLYNWIVSFDVNSLYPTIIRQLNISPETLTDEVDTGFEAESKYSLEDDIHRVGALIDCTYDTSYLKERNLCLTCNGNLIKRDKKGFLPEMIGDLYNNRVEVKGLMKKYQKELEELIKDHTNDIDFEERKVELEKQIATYKNEQTAIKVLMNSLYGQLGNKYCRWYDIRIPRSITKTGQTMIRYIARRMNEFLNAECGTTGFDYVTAIDTDSVTGDTVINVDGQDISISDFYEQNNEEFLVEDNLNNNFVKRAHGITQAVDKEGNLTNSNIKYIMKHRVKKKLYRITVDGDSVVVTCDHSIMIKRDNKIIEVKPTELISGDVIIKIK